MKNIEVFLIIFQIFAICSISFSTGFVVSRNSLREILDEKELKNCLLLNLFAFVLNIGLIVFNLYRLMRW